MESRIYVPSNPGINKCPAKYLLVTLLIVFALIALLGYLARERHIAAVVGLPTDTPEGEQLEPVFMDIADSQFNDLSKDKPLTEDGGKELIHQDAPKEAENVVIQADPVTQASFQTKTGGEETNYLESEITWEGLEDNDPQITSQISENHLVTQSTVSNDSEGLGLLGRLWSTIWSSEKQKATSNQTDSISGNITAINSGNSSEQTVLNVSRLPGEVSGTSPSRVTALIPSVSAYQQDSAPGHYDQFGHLMQSSPSPTEPATLPPIGNMPPPCDDYPSPYVKDFVSHALHTGDKQGRYVLHDFEIAVKSDPELGIIEIGADLAMFSLVAASTERRAVVLQPNHICARNLMKMVQLNELSELITVKELGVSNKRGFGRFITEDQDDNVLIPVSESDVTLERLDNHVIVNMITLDDVTDYVRFQKAILKVSTGRFQPSLFTSATELFSKIKIHYVFMDWKYERANEEAAIKTISFLKSQEFEPRSRLKNGFGLITAFYRYWPEHVIWVNKFPW